MDSIHVKWICFSNFLFATISHNSFETRIVCACKDHRSEVWITQSAFLQPFSEDHPQGLRGHKNSTVRSAVDTGAADLSTEKKDRFSLHRLALSEPCYLQQYGPTRELRSPWLTHHSFQELTVNQRHPSNKSIISKRRYYACLWNNDKLVPFSDNQSDHGTNLAFLAIGRGSNSRGLAFVIVLHVNSNSFVVE